MFLKNTTVRLITINTKMNTTMDANQKVVGAKMGKSFDILPAGDAVDVPAAHCKKKYVQHLLEVGDLIEVVAPKKEAAKEESTSEESNTAEK